MVCACHRLGLFLMACTNHTASDRFLNAAAIHCSSAHVRDRARVTSLFIVCLCVCHFTTLEATRAPKLMVFDLSQKIRSFDSVLAMAMPT